MSHDDPHYDDHSHIPGDSARFLAKPLPRYASGGKWVINGKPIDMNALKSPFEKKP